MTETSDRVTVGWCHGCGTLQLRDDMPMVRMSWSPEPEHTCVAGDGEPWGMGVWDKGDHDPACPTVGLARTRTVDWTPTFAECTCGAADDDWDEED